MHDGGRVPSVDRLGRAGVGARPAYHARLLDAEALRPVVGQRQVGEDLAQPHPRTELPGDQEAVAAVLPQARLDGEGDRQRRVVHRRHGPVAQVGDELGDGQQHDRVAGVARPRRGPAQRRRRGAQQLPVHRLGHHDHVLQLRRKLLRLLLLLLAPVVVRVHPALVPAGDAHQVRPQRLGRPLQLPRHLRGRLHGRPSSRTLANRRVRVEEALPPVRGLVKLGEDVRHVPGSVAQRVVPTPEAVGAPPLHLRRAVGLVEHVGAVAPHRGVPERAAEDVVLLGEAPEVGPDHEAGLFVRRRDAPEGASGVLGVGALGPRAA